MDKRSHNSSKSSKKQKDTLLKAFSIIRYFVKPANQKEFEDNKLAMIVELIKCAQILNNARSTTLQESLYSMNTIKVFRVCLIDRNQQIRENTIKLFRYMMNNKEILKMYRKQGIYIFVSKIVEKDPNRDTMQEIIEAIKFIRRWIVVDSSSFPKLLANSLVALAEA